MQQVGSPATLYQKPANIFVGGFIGAMVFLTLPYADGALKLQSGENWALPANIKAVLDRKGYSGKPVTVGIRPEHFQPKDSAAGQSISVTPDLVELLGAEKLVHFTFEGQTVVSSLPADLEISENKSLGLILQLEKLSYFDPDTQLNILVG
jgi:multiple sugar transport system ATP-binding protein